MLSDEWVFVGLSATMLRVGALVAFVWCAGYVALAFGRMADGGEDEE